MKTMTCRNLGGACNVKLRASTFEEMAEMSKKHAMEMFQKGDQGHINAMNEMMKLMSDPGAMKRWMDGRRKEFEELPEER